MEPDFEGDQRVGIEGGYSEVYIFSWEKTEHI